MSREIKESEGSFTTEVDGHKAHLDFDQRGGAMIITHTVVPPEIGGRGIAAELVQAAFEAARRDGLKVSPACSYAASWLQRHPDYADLLL